MRARAFMALGAAALLLLAGWLGRCSAPTAAPAPTVVVVTATPTTAAPATTAATTAPTAAPAPTATSAPAATPASVATATEALAATPASAATAAPTAPTAGPAPTAAVVLSAQVWAEKGNPHWVAPTPSICWGWDPQWGSWWAFVPTGTVVPVGTIRHGGCAPVTEFGEEPPALRLEALYPERNWTQRVLE